MNCNPVIQSFNQSQQTVISVNSTLRDRICNIPTISVWHRKPAGGFELANVHVQLSGMPLTEIIVDHGGAATGFIKIQ